MFDSADLAHELQSGDQGPFSDVPHAVVNGYFVRDWHSLLPNVGITSEVLALEEIISSNPLLIVDHIDNLRYGTSPRRLRFDNERLAIEIRQIEIASTTAWCIRSNSGLGLRCHHSKDETVQPYFDLPAGAGGRIRLDFVFTKRETAEIIDSFLTRDEVPTEYEFCHDYYPFLPEVD